MKYVNLLIKPASSLCNMRCAYCFYTDESEHRLQKSMGIMTKETAGKLIDTAFSAAEKRSSVSFTFQGGEPTLAGLAFFESFVKMVKDRNMEHLPVAYGIQTNGLNLDAAWVAFLKEHHFLVGVSLDGGPALHDRFRKDAQGQGTFDRVVEKVKLLLQNGVDTNILCVVNGQTAKKPQRVYRALKELGTRYLQFIPCLDPLEAPRGSMPWSLAADAYGRFLCGLFDEWYKDWRNGQYVSIRQFDDWVHIAMGFPAGTCASSGNCGGYLVAEADGSLYPCDFYVLDEYRLGCAENDLNALMTSERMETFLRRGMKKPADCLNCPYFRLCRGGCPRDWEKNGNGGMRNSLCAAFRMIFAHAGERIFEIARTERMAQR